ncbi:hypothetical protein V6N13_011734 [Hibiscus sabdariffa]|uniref:Uncharacterized protein n=1 Tax=Hibiscus sabdariffa TaxID=183260 RepID=A0ABR2SDP7_9ROSI
MHPISGMSIVQICPLTVMLSKFLLVIIYLNRHADGRGLIISCITPDEPGSSSVLYCMVEPQPGFSTYREASFGYGIFDIKNISTKHMPTLLGTEIKMHLLPKLILSGFTNRYWNPFGKSFVAS